MQSNTFQEEKVTQEQNVQAFAGTWKDNVPVFHYSWGPAISLEVMRIMPPKIFPVYDMEITWECELKAKDYAIEQLQRLERRSQWQEKEIAPKAKTKPKDQAFQTSNLKKQESPEVLKKLEPTDGHDDVYSAYNHVYGINK